MCTPHTKVFGLLSALVFRMPSKTFRSFTGTQNVIHFVVLRNEKQ